MKLCIENNALRPRLSAADVQEFAAGGLLTGEVHFGIGSENRLTYTLKRHSESAEVEADYTGRQIIIRVPAAVADTWTGTNQVGFAGCQQLAAGRELRILVEKDLGYH